MKYKVPFVNYPLQYRLNKKEIDKTIKGVLENGDLILRKDVLDFESSVAKFLGVKYGIGVNSCTDAMILSLKAAGIKKGDEVITVSHTFFATIEAIYHTGARPVLIDVKDDYLMDEDKIEKAITARTKAIIPVHLNGRMCNMEKLTRIAKKRGLIIIEDAAQALGAEFKGRKAGAWGLAGCFSFYPAKLLGAVGDGGLVVSGNKRASEQIRLLRHHCQKPKGEIACYGFTSRLDNLQAAILNVKFKYLPRWLKRRRQIAKIYHNGLSGIKELKLPPSPNFGSEHYDVYQNYVVRAQQRNRLFKYLKKSGVETLIKDPIANHKQKKLGLSRFSLPVSEKLAEEVLSLPMYPELSDSQIYYVIKCVKNFYSLPKSVSRSKKR